MRRIFPEKKKPGKLYTVLVSLYTLLFNLSVSITEATEYTASTRNTLLKLTVNFHEKYKAHNCWRKRRTKRMVYYDILADPPSLCYY